MAEIKENMYVRLQNDVENVVVINRIANIFDNTILTENDGSIYQGEYTKENIIKSSYNIIDLIEEGDYVNGFEVLRIDKECNLYPKTLKCQYPNNTDYFDIFNDEIKSIVTKEQMEAMKYEVK